MTIKTLHHYHKIGLLQPKEINESGYRLYGREELERLQEILFYRELEFPLYQIKAMLDRRSDRKSILKHQEALLLDRIRRMETIIQTLRLSINDLEGGRKMDSNEMFIGFKTVEEWDQALRAQNQHLKETYEMEPLGVTPENIQAMNEQAVEGMTFMRAMANYLKEGMKHNEDQVTDLISHHLTFLNQHGHQTTPQDFVSQTLFFLNDDFHLNMLESQQTGLAYYLHAAAAAYAVSIQKDIE